MDFRKEKKPKSCATNLDSKSGTLALAHIHSAKSRAIPALEFIFSIRFLRICYSQYEPWWRLPAESSSSPFIVADPEQRIRVGVRDCHLLVAHPSSQREVFQLVCLRASVARMTPPLNQGNRPGPPSCTMHNAGKCVRPAEKAATKKVSGQRRSTIYDLRCTMYDLRGTRKSCRSRSCVTTSKG